MKFVNYSCSLVEFQDEAAVKSVEKRDTVSVSKRRCKSAVSLRNQFVIYTQLINLFIFNVI